MSNQCDSEAHFEARAREYGVGLPLRNALTRNGIRTLAHLAFAIGRPGADVPEAQFDTWANTLNGGVQPAMGEMAALRRLHFESEVVVTASLKAAVEAPDDSVVKPIPFAERTTRMNDLRARLGGVAITGQNEPSHHLLDECCQQFEKRTLMYVEPCKCTCRESEVSHAKTGKKLKLDASSLAITETKSVPDEAISTTFSLSLCLLRRGIAYDFAGLISFNAHRAYCDKLLRHLTIEPPPGFQATSLNQVLRADREVFAYLARTCADIRPTGAVKPLDAFLDNALSDYQTAFHLLPLPKEQFQSNLRFRTEQVQRSQTAQASYGGKGKGRGGKSMGRGKGGGSSSAPRGYLGCVGRDGTGRPLCFDFNTGECPHAPPGGACPKGRRVCFKAGCFKPHAFKAAHASELPQPPQNQAE